MSMTREDAIDRLEFIVRHSCQEANGDNIGDCDLCWRNPCNDMKALKIVWEDRQHGEWMKEIIVEEPRKNKRAYARCTECGVLFNHYKFAVLHFDFCPKCGTDMRRGGEAE